MYRVRFLFSKHTKKPGITHNMLNVLAVYWYVCIERLIRYLSFAVLLLLMKAHDMQLVDYAHQSMLYYTS